MKKAPASKSSISLAEMPRWVKDRTAAKNTALKIKGNHGTNRKVPTKTKSMTDLKKSASTSKFGGKLEKDGEYDKMDYNNLPARWFDQDKKVEIREKAKAPFQRPPMRPYPPNLPATKRKRHFGKGPEHSDARVKLLRIYDTEEDYYQSKGIYERNNEGNQSYPTSLSVNRRTTNNIEKGVKVEDNDQTIEHIKFHSLDQTTATKPLRMVQTDELEATQIPKTAINEAVEDEDFLRLDMSKIPLDTFDNPDMFETKSPEDWLKSNSKGKSPYYADGAWSWRTCQVEGYDSQLKKYKINFDDLGKTKYVKRLNLQFDEETDEAFQSRLQYAIDLREAAKANIRYDYFLENQPDESVECIPDWTLNDIAKRIGGVLKTLQSPLVQELVEDVANRY